MAESLFLAKEVFTHMEVRSRRVGYACGAEGCIGAEGLARGLWVLQKEGPADFTALAAWTDCSEIGTCRPPHHSAGHDDAGHAAFREFAISATIAAFLLMQIWEAFISFCGAPPQLLQFLPLACVAWSDGIA